MKPRQPRSKGNFAGRCQLRQKENLEDERAAVFLPCPFKTLEGHFFIKIFKGGSQKHDKHFHEFPAPVIFI